MKSPKYRRYAVRWSAYGHRRLVQLMEKTGHTSIGRMVSHALALYQRTKKLVDSGYEIWAIRSGTEKDDQKRVTVVFGDQGINGKSSKRTSEWPVELVEDPLKKGEN